MLVIVIIALWRGLRCCRVGLLPLGWFSLMFFVGAVLAAQTMETLGQNQVIEWVAFNVLSFSCGLGLASRSQIGPANAAVLLSVRPYEARAAMTPSGRLDIA